METTTIEEAKARCRALMGCRGFTFKGGDGGAEEQVKVFFKDKWELGRDSSTEWSACRYFADTEVEQWIMAMKTIAQQAAEAAAQAAVECKQYAPRLPSVHSLARDRAASKVPCRFHQQGRCANGFSCQFSHEANVSRPLYMKMDKPCLFFARGQCARGTECPFAHGEEERQQISQIRVKRGRKRPWEDGIAPQLLAESRPAWPLAQASQAALALPPLLADGAVVADGIVSGARAKPWAMPQATPWY